MYEKIKFRNKHTFPFKKYFAGKITFGGYDSNVFNGPLRYVPQLEAKWKIAIDSITDRNGDKLGCKNGCEVCLKIFNLKY